MKVTRNMTPVDAGRRDVEEQRAKLARLEADKAAAEAEFEALDARAGVEVLDAPDTAAGIANSMRELRDRIDIIGRAVEAQRPRVKDAESKYLQAEADALQIVADQARRALERHQARTAELLAQLKQHEGAFVPEHMLIQAQRDLRMTGVPDSWTVPVSANLQQALAEAELPVAILRAMAAGEDPTMLVNAWQQVHGSDTGNLYPACVWGPDALVAAPSYRVQFERAQQHLDELEAEERRLPGELEEWAAQQANSPHILEGLTSRQRRANTLPARLADARRTLAELNSQR